MANDLTYYRRIIKAIRKACSDQLQWVKCKTESIDPDFYTGSIKIIGNIIPSELCENGRIANIRESVFLNHESKNENIADPHHALISELVENKRKIFHEQWVEMRNNHSRDWHDDDEDGMFHGIVKSCKVYSNLPFGKKFKGPVYDDLNPHFSWDFRVNDVRLVPILIKALQEAKKLGMPMTELLQGHELLTDVLHRLPSVLFSVSSSTSKSSPTF